MKNKIAGFIVIGIAALIGFIILSFNLALKSIINESCSHGVTCPMWGDLHFQTTVSIALMALVVLTGLYLIFFGKEEKIVTKVHKVKIKEQIKPKEVTKENYKSVLAKLEGNEKKVLEQIIEAKGSIMQSVLVDKAGLSKVKVTRVLDRLEGKEIIERKRRGMTNVVILKH